MENFILTLILKSHPGLTDHDITYGQKLLDIYGNNYNLFIRLIPNVYIDNSKLSTQIDNMIKARKLQKLDLHMKDNLQEKIAIIALKNLMEYITVIEYPLNNIFTEDGLYMRFLNDACVDANYDILNFNKVKIVTYGMESGRFIKINKMRYEIKGE